MVGAFGLGDVASCTGYFCLFLLSCFLDFFLHSWKEVILHYYATVLRKRSGRYRVYWCTQPSYLVLQNSIELKSLNINGVSDEMAMAADAHHCIEKPFLFAFYVLIDAVCPMAHDVYLQC